MVHYVNVKELKWSLRDVKWLDERDFGFFGRVGGE